MTDTLTAQGTPQADHLTTIQRVGNSRRDGPSLIPGNQRPLPPGSGGLTGFLGLFSPKTML